MGTNYYLERVVGEQKERLHIGKYSAGSIFVLRIHEGRVNSVEKWIDLLLHARDNEGGYKIFDEGGNEVSASKVIVLMCRACKKNPFEFS